MRVKHLPSFCSIFPMTTAANNLLTLGYAAGPLGEVLDLIWPDPPHYIWGALLLLLIKFSQKCTVPAERTSRSTLWPPPPRRLGPAGPNLAKDVLRVKSHLRAEFKLGSPEGACAYSKQTFIHTYTCTNTHCQIYNRFSPKLVTSDNLFIIKLGLPSKTNKQQLVVDVFLFWRWINDSKKIQTTNHQADDINLIKITSKVLRGTIVIYAK